MLVNNALTIVNVCCATTSIQNPLHAHLKQTLFADPHNVTHQFIHAANPTIVVSRFVAHIFQHNVVR
ncbi:MAG: hypothetical protein ACJASL_002759 [Paraglaciecola sp.]|jgi:hypothetical protein